MLRNLGIKVLFDSIIMNVASKGMCYTEDVTRDKNRLNICISEDF